MKLEGKIQIIDEYIEGKPLREIGKDLKISKDTVNAVIRDWEDGKIDYLKHERLEKGAIIEIARFVRKENINLDELLGVIFLASEGRKLGYRGEDTLSLLETLRGTTPENAKTLIDTILSFAENGISLTRLQSEVEELQSKRQNLMAENTSLEEKKGLLNREIQRKQAKIKDQNTLIETRNGNIEALTKDENKQREKIARSEKIYDIAQRLQLNIEDIQSFMETAMKYDLKIENMKNADSISKSLRTANKSPGVLPNLYNALKTLNARGWDLDSFIKVATSIENIKGTKKVINDISDLEKTFKEIRGKIKSEEDSLQIIGRKIESKNATAVSLESMNNGLLSNVLRLREERETEESKLQNIKEELKRLEKEKQDSIPYIDAANAIMGLIKTGKFSSKHLSLFSNDDIYDMDEEMVNKLRSSLIQSILKISSGEIAAIEFTDRKTIKIIDGREYENAVKTMESAEKIESDKMLLQNMIDIYGNDKQAFVGDVLLGKTPISSELDGVLEKPIYNAINSHVRDLLSQIIKVYSEKDVMESYPIEIQLNGKVTMGMIAYQSVVETLLNGSKTVSVLNAENSSNVEVSLCQAVKFLLLDILDEEKGNKRRAQIREIYSKSIMYKDIMDTAGKVSKVTLKPFVMSGKTSNLVNK